jgi:eukaryotic-like serine/threonine-protein kinase
MSDDFERRIDDLKAAMVAITRSTAPGISDAQFRETRRMLLSAPHLQERIPQWLRKSSTLVEADRLIRAEADLRPGGKYRNRADLISETLNPLLDQLQDQRDVFEASGELGERLGGGGFGEVFRWRHKFLEMDFAVKVLNPSFPADDEQYVARFFREARILLKLNHPGIVRVYDVGMLGKRPYIRMELLDGQDINAALTTLGRFAPDRAGALIADLADALAHAHSQGIVHRDIKPSNVYITKRGRVCLIDFGLGAFVEGDLVSRLTATGQHAVGGLYVAPELVANPRRLDFRDDLYSMGALWFTMLTSRPPAGTSSRAQLEALTDITPAHRAAVIKSLGDERERFQSAAEMAAAIRSTLMATGTLAIPQESPVAVPSLTVPAEVAKPASTLRLVVAHGMGSRRGDFGIDLVNPEDGVSAKAPYVELTVPGPHQVAQFGLDDKGNHGLPRQLGPPGSPVVKFRGGADTIIHPGTSLALTKIEWKGALDKMPNSIEVPYSVVAEGTSFTKGSVKVGFP